ncbi:MAG TPA: hypothetical protein VMG59_12245 [Phycisphaerae bacterium]|nr:hypothetical protein [Phycisphaerae bacterium]
MTMKPENLPPCPAELPMPQGGCLLCGQPETSASVWMRLAHHGKQRAIKYRLCHEHAIHAEDFVDAIKDAIRRKVVAERATKNNFDTENL